MGKPPFLYALFDPNEPGHIRYVGMTMTNAKRPYDHAAVALRNRPNNTHTLHWVRKLQGEGRKYSVFILKEFSTDTSFEEVCRAERDYIISIKAQGHRLTNSNDGGEGSFNPSPAVRQKMRDRMLGHKFSETTRLRLSEAGKRYNQEHPERREKLRAASLGNTYAVGGKSFSGITHGLEARIKMSKAWTPERRAAQAERNRQRPNLPLAEQLQSIARAEEALAKRKAKLAEKEQPSL